MANNGLRTTDYGLRTADIAVIGAGPAGSLAAELLARAGRSVVVFDPKGPWEKPCGGGVTARALDRYKFLVDDQAWPKQRIDRITLIGPSRRRFSMSFPEEPFVIYSRERLNGLLLARAREAGAVFVREAVARFERVGGRWRVSTNQGEWTADLLVGADGAAGIARTRLAGQFDAGEFAAAVGFNAPGGGSTEVVIDFPPGVAGYLWAFPRTDHTNFGVAVRARERTGPQLRDMVVRFAGEYYGGAAPDERSVTRYGAKIPMLTPRAWDSLRASGDGWALVGDAAGFVDPITGEGIYFALRSAELLAEAVASGGGLGAYDRAWRADFGDDLAHAARYFTRFYLGSFFGAPFIDRTILFAAHHRGVRRVMARALAGLQPYETLKRDLILNAIRF
jgi:geranylgeranyl reductase family protein